MDFKNLVKAIVPSSKDDFKAIGRNLFIFSAITVGCVVLVGLSISIVLGLVYVLNLIFAPGVGEMILFFMCVAWWLYMLFLDPIFTMIKNRYRKFNANKSSL